LVRRFHSKLGDKSDDQVGFWNKGGELASAGAEMASWQVGGCCSSSAQDSSGKRLEMAARMARLKIAKDIAGKIE
jgi:hypothetical protein